MKLLLSATLAIMLFAGLAYWQYTRANEWQARAEQAEGQVEALNEDRDRLNQINNARAEALTEIREVLGNEIDAWRKEAAAVTHPCMHWDYDRWLREQSTDNPPPGRLDETKASAILRREDAGQND